MFPPAADAALERMPLLLPEGAAVPSLGPEVDTSKWGIPVEGRAAAAVPPSSLPLVPAEDALLAAAPPCSQFPDVCGLRFGPGPYFVSWDFPIPEAWLPLEAPPPFP